MSFDIMDIVHGINRTILRSMAGCTPELHARFVSLIDRIDDLEMAIFMAKEFGYPLALDFLEAYDAMIKLRRSI